MIDPHFLHLCEIDIIPHISHKHPSSGPIRFVKKLSKLKKHVELFESLLCAILLQRDFMLDMLIKEKS